MRPVLSLSLSLCLLALPTTFRAGEALPADQIAVPPGFQIERLRSAGDREGSWVSMAIDPEGRLYISPQGAIPESGWKADSGWGGLWRVTLDAQGHVEKWEKVPVPIGNAMGMLYAFDRLYVSGSGPEGRAIYTVTDSNGDGTLDAWKLFKKVPGGDGEHGAHALVLGPDQKIYIAHGNSTPLIEGVAYDSPYRNYAEDTLLPRIKDPVATFFDNIKSPYGTVLRTDRDGTKWELYAGGFRNEYDIDFNEDGELFTYDSDMEWDVGLPWYRPTRILHVVPGGEYGFREGDSKWPAWRPDSLPSVVDIGLGSPTGVKFGTKSKFPEKYRKAFFVMDWTYGRILAVHMRPKGSTYEAKGQTPIPLNAPTKSEDVEEFVKAKGLPVTDLEFGKDGAMYFTVGGRGTQAGLYRVAWTGGGVPGGTVDVQKATDGSRSLLHSVAEGDASVSAKVQLAFQHPEDRFLNFAARTWLEKNTVQTEAGKSADEALTRLLAAVRTKPKEEQATALKELTKYPLDSLTPEQRLLKYRVINVSFCRQGRPAPEIVTLGTEKLLKQYPAKGEQAWPQNYELSQLLVWLTNPALGDGGDPKQPAPKEATEVIARTLALLESSSTQQEQIWFARVLADAAPSAWTPEQRKAYWAWWSEKAPGYKGGNSFVKFLGAVRERALSKCSPEERTAAEAILAQPPKPKFVAPPRPFVKAWTLAELDGALPELAKGRNLAKGKELFTAAQCARCHKFKGDGGDIGPDLTAAAARYQPHDLLEAIIDPNKGVSEQYAVYTVKQFDGKLEATGMIVGDNQTEMQVLTDPLNGTIEHINKYKEPTKTLVPVSFMPPGLLNSLSRDEVLDLLAFIESGVK